MTFAEKGQRLPLDLIGVLGVLTISRLLIQSAYLNSHSMIPWIWAVGFGLGSIVERNAFPGKEGLKTKGVPTGIVCAFLIFSLAFTAPEGYPGTLFKWVILLKNNLLQITGYLMGTETALLESLKPTACHLICAGAFLVLLWGRQWRFRRLFLGAVLFFGCIRWNQYVPDLENLLIQLGLAWCFSAAFSEESVSSGFGRYPGRFHTSLLLAMGILMGTMALTAVVPLEGVNRWIGSWMPGQDSYRNEYTQFRPVGFQLEDTQWHPLGHRLGGTVTPVKEPVMLVKTSRPGLHLRGTVKSTYTGQSWESEPIQLSPLRIQPSSSGEEPFVITVRPLNTQDRTIYTPLHTDRVIAGNRKILVGNGGVLRLGFQWFQGKDLEYRAEGYLAVAEPPSGEDLEPYLQLPELSLEFREAALGIAGSQGTDRDRMERLVHWLKANGRYRLDVGSPDPNRDFVEQFVLGSREGYCTYFASALAVMGRVAGIPTRYVEGYLLPGQTTGGQTYLVTSDWSHAWVESYIAGEGWIAFEPTPALNLVGELVTDMAVDEGLSGLGEISGESRPAQDSLENPSPLTGLLSWGYAVVLGMLLATGARVLWVNKEWRRGVAGPQGDLWRLYSVLSVLSLLVPGPDSSELPTEQLQRGKANFSFRAFASHDIIGDTNQLLYGKHPIESTGFQVLLEELWQIYRNQKGTLHYWVARYGTLSLFNSYTPLIGNRQFRKDVNHGADQPHTATQS